MGDLGIGGHQSAKMQNDEWLTPPAILELLGEFDLDPCAPIKRPWDTARWHYDKNDDGLIQIWKGRVWCNPPYGEHALAWLTKLATHGNGIALVFARTETAMFFRAVWPVAHAILFIEGRLHFHYVTGERARANSGAPSVLIAYGEENAVKLQQSRIRGHFVRLRP